MNYIIFILNKKVYKYRAINEILDYWEENSEELEPIHFSEWLDMMEDIELEKEEIYVYVISTRRECFINNCSGEAKYIHEDREPTDTLSQYSRIVSCEEHNPQNLSVLTGWNEIP